MLLVLGGDYQIYRSAAESPFRRSDHPSANSEAEHPNLNLLAHQEWVQAFW
jgi:hypothetical protein